MDYRLMQVKSIAEWEHQDEVGEKCVKNDAGELSLSDDDKMKAWVELQGSHRLEKYLNIQYCLEKFLKSPWK